jgi:hypothetical protein
MSMWQPPKRPPFEFPGFPRKADEDGATYVDRYTREHGAIQPWEEAAPIEPPKEEPRKPYKEPREVGEEG